MPRRIDGSMVSVQVETARQDTWVPGGFALPAGSPTAVGADLVTLFARSSDTVLERVTSPMVGTAIVPDEKDGAEPIRGTSVSTTTALINGQSVVTSVAVTDRGNRSVGPIIVQTRVPIPVTAGDTVTFAGKFAVRQSFPDSLENLPRTVTTDVPTGLNVVVTLWGITRTEDEYGEETITSAPLLQYTALLQPTNTVLPSVNRNQVTFTVPGVSPAVVPAGVTSVHMTVTLTSNVTGELMTVQYGMPRKGHFLNPPVTLPIMTFSEESPLRIVVQPKPPSVPGVSGTVSNGLSRTGWAFLVPASAKWTTPASTVDIGLVALPGAAQGQTVRVWEWTGSARGALLATVVLAANTRTVRQVTTATGYVEVESSTPVHVEFVCAATWSTLAQEQTRAYRYTYADVTGDVVRVSAEGIEADLAVHSIRFVSDAAPGLLAAGKRVRVVNVETGTVIASGTVRGRRIVHDGEHQAQVELTVHSSWGKLGSTECQVAYNQLPAYAPILNSLGLRAFIDGVEVTGPPQALPDWGGGFPSFREDGLTTDDALLMARNTVRGYVRVRGDDSLEVLSALPLAVALDVSDQPDQGHSSFTVQSEFGADSNDVINVVAVQENTIDGEELFDRSLSDEPVPNEIGYVVGTSRVAEYRDAPSVAAYGQVRRSFPVVRGSGTWASLEADDYGPGFRPWAEAILATTATEKEGPRAITVPVDSPAMRARMAALTVLDAVCIRFRGTVTVMRIRRITHRISPEKWVVDLRFDVTGDQVYWLPETPPPVLALGDTDAGTLSRPASSVIDAGHPDDTITALLDGGNP